MGLDMYLEARKRVSAWSFQSKEEKDEFARVMNALELTDDDIDLDSPSISVSVPAMYWRKANSIHAWFVDTIQKEDDCDTYEVSREVLEELVSVCEEVIKNPEQAEELMPTREGFFFGGTEYGEWYFEQVEYTAKTLRKLLDNEKLSCYSFYYSSSW